MRKDDDTSAFRARRTDIDFALGRLARGIVHEAVNPLNGILMMAELAEVSIGDDAAVRDCLASISGAARDSGSWLRQLADMASAHDYRPTGDDSIAAVFDMARGLLGSRASRSGCKLSMQIDNPPSPEMPMHTVAVATAIALLVDTMLDAGACGIDVTARCGDELTVTIETDIDSASDGQETAIAERFAGTVCADHGGSLERDGQSLRLGLPMMRRSHRAD